MATASWPYQGNAINHVIQSPRKPLVTVFNGIVLGTLDRYVPDDPERIWHLSDGHRTVSCLIPNADLLHDLLSSPLTCYRLRMVDWTPQGDASTPETLPVLIDAADTPNCDPLRLLPKDICPVEGVLDDALALLEEIGSVPLRDFVHGILCNRKLYVPYWTSPATPADRYACPGGLASHSVKIAEDLACLTGLRPHQRDLGIAAGLLSRIGEIWKQVEGRPLPPTVSAIGTPLISLTRLSDELRRLESAWPDGAHAMRLLIGRYRPHGPGAVSQVARPPSVMTRSLQIGHAVGRGRARRGHRMGTEDARAPQRKRANER